MYNIRTCIYVCCVSHVVVEEVWHGGGKHPDDTLSREALKSGGAHPEGTSTSCDLLSSAETMLAMCFTVSLQWRGSDPLEACLLLEGCLILCMHVYARCLYGS